MEMNRSELSAYVDLSPSTPCAAPGVVAEKKKTEWILRLSTKQYIMDAYQSNHYGMHGVMLSL
jgi:hypothetical protein